MALAIGLSATLGAALIACGQPGTTTSTLNACFGPDTPEAQDGGAPTMTPAQEPQIKSTAEGCVPSSCGGIAWRVIYTLPVPAANAGWIVQEISFTRDETGPGAMPAVMNHYWEAFWVTKGSSGPECFKKTELLFDDSFDQKSRSGTTGTTTWIGKAKFYEGTLPAAFKRAPDPNTSPAGVLRFTDAQPSFWDGTGTEHNLTRTWDCSAGDGNAIGSVQPVPADVACPASSN
ncbi:MAG: hypothetical protein ACMG6S_23555 [Byssovorax sp.]